MEIKQSDVDPRSCETCAAFREYKKSGKKCGAFTAGVGNCANKDARRK